MNADHELLGEHARLTVVYEGLYELKEKIEPKITEQQSQLFYGFLLILEETLPRLANIQEALNVCRCNKELERAI